MENILIDSLKTSLIDRNMESTLSYQHKLISNREEKIISLIRKELENCDEFIISVAFITLGGVTMILEQLKDLDERGIKGKILTGDYLTFTQPKALKKLLEFRNIELKILSDEKFHAKGYFFRKGDIWTMIVGSSNLTQTALTVNFEWNLKINSLKDGKIAFDILNNFYEIFDKVPRLDISSLEEYEKIYKLTKEYKEKRKQEVKEYRDITPNLMQRQALENLKVLRSYEKRGLLISATGTGKTYLSAFDVKNTNPQRVLFIAHRKTILQKAKEAYENILREKKIAIYGDEEVEGADVVFAMIQTLSKENHLTKFSPDYFDYIVVDEVHHGGAKSYQKVINYFTPKFLLGMTATPERGDNFDIYRLFDNNIAYEIRLHDALKEELLCPFHYFGISDIEIDGELINEKSSIKKLTTEERVNHILEKSRFYGYSGEKLHGLIFVSRVDEALLLEEKFQEKGVKSIALVGDDSDEKREKAISDLENGKIEYIITVDIFNEGVDIPCVNQVILLRPTESSIVYIQQLGRGLRKYPDKEYVVILDFIGNYEKNFLIPIAVSQNSNYDKDYMKRFIMNGTDMIPGESSIIFEEIVKERIFENINKTNFSTKKNIEKDFILLEKQLGRIPMLYDFFEKNMIEPSVILKYKKTYDEVLRILKPREEIPLLNDRENNYLTFLSSFFTPAKRVHEMIILQELLVNEKINIEDIEEVLKNKYSLKEQKESIENAIKHLAKEIFVSLSTAKEFLPIVERYEDKIVLVSDFKKSYLENSYFKNMIDDLIRYNLAYVEKNYKQVGEESILKYKEYTKQEAFWYLNLDFNNGYQVSGYTVFEEQRKVILFITLDDTPPFTQYDNQFFDNRRFTWYSKNQRCLKRNGKLTAEGKIAENYYTLEAFIKKKSGENFYYLGQVKEVLNPKEIINYKGNSVVEYELKLKNEIENNLYEYLLMKN
ncbi:DEAD/DEAH box helicase [uncultured Fusobacterium sp.]|uniref:DEAD/DEAH box helicase n=1 Tax=uncultured Fusobacterium sp. TaxID=159267 RepID=UPI0025D4D44D|nr:DEAD/DEAH box helicase [uncultured Fusobacterium sp.]